MEISGSQIKVLCVTGSSQVRDEVLGSLAEKLGVEVGRPVPEAARLLGYDGQGSWREF